MPDPVVKGTVFSPKPPISVVKGTVFSWKMADPVAEGTLFPRKMPDPVRKGRISAEESFLVEVSGARSGQGGAFRVGDGWGHFPEVVPKGADIGLVAKGALENELTVLFDFVGGLFVEAVCAVVNSFGLGDFLGVDGGPGEQIAQRIVQRPSFSESGTLIWGLGRLSAFIM